MQKGKLRPNGVGAKTPASQTLRMPAVQPSFPRTVGETDAHGLKAAPPSTHSKPSPLTLESELMTRPETLDLRNETGTMWGFRVQAGGAMCFLFPWAGRACL